MSSTVAASADVATLDGIIKAMYDVIAGAAGQARDWERFHSLYAPGARLMPIVSPKGEPAHVRVLSPEDFRKRVEPIFEREGFFERETGRKVEMVGSMAHVLSEYESMHEPGGEPFDRATNSMQLIYDGTRWWIVSVMWHTARSQ
jgi:hypothetical protein